MSKQMHENRQSKNQNDYKDDSVVKRRIVFSIWLTTTVFPRPPTVVK